VPDYMSEDHQAKRPKMSSTTCINTIRVLAADVVQKANSGHPGAPMGCAPIAHLLWGEVMKYSPRNPKWSDRDRFVLSNGHACALQYIMLHLTGYDLTMDDLKSFRQLNSKTPGHPELHITPGIEVSTGPLGQGISNAVGLAIAEAHLAARFNKPGFNIVDHYTYVICGDGCLQEGVSSEASSLAGHLGLGKLIVFYDDNLITIDGETELSFTEDVGKRYEAYGWHVQTIHDGNSYDGSDLRQAVANARAVLDKPSMIKVRTTIGFGSKKQGTEKVHGSPLGDDDIKHLKTLFGFDPEAKFVVPDEVRSYYTAKASEGQTSEDQWNELFARYAVEHPHEAAEFTRAQNGDFPENWHSGFPTYTPQDKELATRQSSQQVLSKVVDVLPELIGGSADLTPSTLTKVNGNKVDFSHQHPEGRYLRYGVREHAMSSLCNGIAAHGGLIPFASTFLNFVGYALGAIRLSALSHLRVLYIMTHDSIGLGEDGPTHQPVETLASLRAMPNMLVLRPADGNEVSGAYRIALEQKHMPSTIALSRQNCANLEGSSADKVALGAYVLRDAPDAKVIIVATGSEVQLAVKAAEALQAEGVNARVVSFPSWELFERQSLEYKETVLAPGIPVLSVEAAAITGWHKYSHGQIGMITFGMSAPAPKVFDALGFTVANVSDKAKKLVEFYGTSAPSLTRHAF